jgi:hypothetical protein
MKRLNYFIAFLFMSVLFSCNSQKKTYSPEGTNLGCSYCDSLLNGGYYIDYPFREVDKNADGDRIPLVNKADSIYKDSAYAITEFEMQRTNSNLFCFLGMKEKEVDKYFHPKFRRNEWETGSTESKIMIYYFNLGNFMKNKGAFNQPVNSDDVDDNSEFWLIGSGDFRLEYKKVKNDFIYTGTMQDSINLRDCINKEKKK